MLQLYRIQDIQLEDLALKSDYYNRVFNGDINGAKSLIKASPQLEGKVLDSNILNKYVDSILYLESLYYENVEDVLNLKDTEFNMSIDELIYMTIYNPFGKYEKNNFVSYNDEIYYCLKDPLIGTSPDNSEYWLYLGLKGEKAYPLMGINYRGEYDPEKIYYKFDMVMYEQNLYVAKKVTILNTGVKDEEFWYLAVKTGGQGIFVSETEPLKMIVGQLWLKIIGNGGMDLSRINTELYVKTDVGYDNIYIKNREIELILNANEWSANAPFVQTVTVEGMTENIRPQWGVLQTISNPSLSKNEEKMFGFIKGIRTNNGSVTFTCLFKKPTINLRVLGQGI